MPLAVSGDVFVASTKIVPSVRTAPASPLLHLPTRRNIFLESDSEDEDEDDQQLHSLDQALSDRACRPPREFRPRLSRNIFLDDEEEQEEEEDVFAQRVSHGNTRVDDHFVPIVPSGLDASLVDSTASGLQEIQGGKPVLKTLSVNCEQDSATLTFSSPPGSSSASHTTRSARIPRVQFAPLLPAPLRDDELEAERRARLYQMPWMKSFIEIFPALKPNASSLTTSPSCAGAGAIPPPTPPRPLGRNRVRANSANSNPSGNRKQEAKRPRGPRQLFIPRFHAPELQPLSSEGYSWPPAPQGRQTFSPQGSSGSPGSEFSIAQHAHASALKAQAISMTGRVLYNELLSSSPAQRLFLNQQVNEATDTIYDSRRMVKEEQDTIIHFSPFALK